MAIVDTRFPQSGFKYSYKDHDDTLSETFDSGDLPERSMIRIACTGNHYLSVLKSSSEILKEAIFSHRLFSSVVPGQPVQQPSDHKVGIVCLGKK